MTNPQTQTDTNASPYIGGNVSLEGEQIFIGDNASIGGNDPRYETTIANHVTICTGVIIESGATIKSGCMVGRHAFIGVDAHLGDNVKVLERAVVSPGSNIPANHTVNPDGTYAPTQKA